MITFGAPYKERPFYCMNQLVDFIEESLSIIGQVVQDTARTLEGSTEIPQQSPQLPVELWEDTMENLVILRKQ